MSTMELSKNTNEIICPNCNKAFKVDETAYSAILKQVRNSEFEKEAQDIRDQASKDKQHALELATVQAEKVLQEQLVTKDRLLAEERVKANLAFSEQSRISESQVNQLKAYIEQSDLESKVAVDKAVHQLEKERDRLKFALDNAAIEKENLKLNLEQNYNNQLKSKDEIIRYKEDDIARLRDMRQRQSVKLTGETLELHCENEFNILRSSAFKTAYFQKDNDSSDGTKGDYIYREHDEQGNEIISIMFEMKNESEETVVKKKNTDFLKKLDKDRNDKKCEYAVLVSCLEVDNEYYNTGIVDASHHYEKMYIVRPNFFIPIITLLRNPALNSLKYKAALALADSQRVDVTNFENKMNAFKDTFGKNYDLASRRYDEAIASIDKAIKELEKTKGALLSSSNNLRLANDKLQDLSIKKLTHENPTMKSRFENLNNDFSPILPK